MISLKDLLNTVVENPNLHHRWLYTISYLENSGAKKIMRYQPHSDLSLEILKHTAEEARHAYFFRKQIEKINFDPDLKVKLFGGFKAKNFLHLLDVKIMKALKKEMKLNTEDLYYFSYLLTTYAIELRADSLFGLYEKTLKEKKIPITLLSVIKEEENHLRDIEIQIDRHSRLLPFKKVACKFEEDLFNTFISQVEKDIEHNCGPLN
ncbi:MAG: hypothetical protein DRQ88_07940 [Epsilonproteobacteria bacterium]|nr:MAG: hypothetical protein DRQ89_11235 [Campylobacterota bacterium]RLA66053.1 MAG: hypothetical protein DRQ88_07940 [Campylobacterota bacterium]